MSRVKYTEGKTYKDDLEMRGFPIDEKRYKIIKEASERYEAKKRKKTEKPIIKDKQTSLKFK